MKFNTHRTTVTLLVGGILLPLACASTVAERLRETLFLERQVVGGATSGIYCRETDYKYSETACPTVTYSHFPNGTAIGQVKTECIADLVRVAYTRPFQGGVGFTTPNSPVKIRCLTGDAYQWTPFGWRLHEKIPNQVTSTCVEYIADITGAGDCGTEGQ
jgi:hypothetical protein